MTARMARWDYRTRGRQRKPRRHRGTGAREESWKSRVQSQEPGVVGQRPHRPITNPITVPPMGPLTHYPWLLRSEEHTSELQSRLHLVCRLLLEKKKGNFFPSIESSLLI